MIRSAQPITQDDFKKGLVTGSDILNGDRSQSPNCMNIKWKFDDSITKRYGSSTMNTTALAGTAGWAMYDFGATNLRWLVVAHGTGISASTNLGITFASIATTRTQSYQYFERSKNVLICTSDAYDQPLYWAGSGTTFAIALAVNSAPSCKYSINYQGFLILLNSSTRPRIFSYADEALQLTDAWTNNFDIPSSADDEITCAFVLSKRLYVSTRYKLYRVTFVGGNPDWSYLQIKDWGYVPRTVRKITLKEGEVIVGMDWGRRIRIFDGSDDLIASDNIENNNNMCEFAIEKISYAGSGLIVSHAEVDRNEQEYRLNIAIGATTTETTHAIVINGRTLAFYPYSNQQFQSTVMAESAGRTYLMACDRSGRIHTLNSGNRDIAVAINDVYDSPFLYARLPAAVSKSQDMDLFFTPTSSGTLIFQDRADFSSVFSPVKDRIPLVSTTSTTQIVKSIDIPSTHNVYQYRLSSSSNTADPWQLTRIDYYLNNMGIGKGA